MMAKIIKKCGNDDRGFVLILSLIAMVIMTLIGLSLVTNLKTDMALSRNEREAKQAFQLAEAGINEAMARLRLPATITHDGDDKPIITPHPRYIGEFKTDTGYRTISWNANNSLGNDFGYGLGGDRNSADNLNYTVSIRYLDESNPERFCDSNDQSPNSASNAIAPPVASCDDNPAEIVMFGQDFNIDDLITGSIQYGKYPIYEITSTGTTNGTSRTVVAYVGASYFDPDIGAAINTNQCANISGAAAKIEGPAVIGPGCNCTVVTDTGPEATCSNKTGPDNMNDYLGVSLATIKENSDEVHACTNATCSGPGDSIPPSGHIDDVVLDWGSGNSPRLIFIDNSGGKPAKISGNTKGAGVLIVTGDLAISGNVEFEGLVYVLGALTVSGGGGSEHLEIEGAAMSNNIVTLNGNVEVEYEQEVLQNIARALSTSSSISWKRF